MSIRRLVLLGVVSCAKPIADDTLALRESAAPVDSESALPETGQLDSETGEASAESDTEDTAVPPLDCTKDAFDWDGDLTLIKESELRRYRGVRSISGNLDMYWYEGTSYAGLDCLERVEGDARFGGRYVGDIAALGALRRVGGDFTLSGVDAVHIDPLDALFEGPFDGSVQINGNANLTSLAALSGLTSIGGNLQLDYQPASYLGLESLESIGGTAYLLSYLYPSTDIRGLEGLQSVGGDLYLGNADFLTSLAGLDNLREVGGTLILSGNPLLTDLTALRNLQRVGSLDISFNTNLVNVAGLEGIEELEQLSLTNNVSDVSGLSGLRAVHDEIRLSGGYLTDLSGLTALESLGALTLYRNDAMTSLAGLENITSVNSLNFDSTLNLMDVSALANVEAVGVIEFQNLNLESLNGVENIREVGSLCLSAMHQLEGLDGFGGLESVDFLEVSSNVSLTSVSGLSSLVALNEGKLLRNVSLAACDVDLLKSQLEEAGAATVWRVTDDLDYSAVCE